MKKIGFRLLCIVCLPTIPMVLAATHIWDGFADWREHSWDIMATCVRAIRLGEKVAR